MLTLIGTVLLAMTASAEARVRHHHRTHHHRHGLHHHQYGHHRYGRNHDQAHGPRHERTTPLLASSPHIRINSVGQVITDVTR